MQNFKAYTKPNVYIVGRQVIVKDELNRFLADENVNWESDSPVAGEVLAETAGRVCYMSFDKPRPGGNAKYLEHIKEVGHASVLEHAVWNFIFTGVSRTLTHELVRHRLASYSQLSQRYVDESDCGFVVPPALLEGWEAYCAFQNGTKPYDADSMELAADWSNQMFLAKQAYIRHVGKFMVMEYRSRYPDCGLTTVEQVLEAMKALKKDVSTDIRKSARQAARSVLPNATETKIFCTFNARELRHILSIRSSRFAEVEIRKLANEMHRVLAIEAPNIFGDFERVPLAGGTFELTTPHA